ncbi:MFS transporter [Desertihabitans brevis]|uniref:MFS transporter n=1 Tax=Desertihabitans brevis TaxID=2268447 RepID=A0A367YVM3_9ACTN|nr:MFS transporter [Desertihabitans brevis]RCK69589.1 MFS transporter [Desertihabitans brevis]
MSHSSAVPGYRQLFALTGPWFAPVAFVARLPLAMAQLGSLLLVSGVTGSYGAGGLTAGALAVANAVVAPLAGALADRVGQRPVLLVQSIGAALALLALVLTATPGRPLVLVLGCAAIAGALLPQAGTLARVRWRLLASRAERPRLTETAFAYEGAADEASFVLGPALVGLLAALVAPAGALLVAAALVVVFGLAFALHPSATLTRPDRSLPTTTGGGPLLPPGLAVLLLAMLGVGMVFGSVQTGNSVLATAAGEPGLTGGLHALLGVGSVLAGLLVPALPARWTLRRRLLVSAAALLVLSLPLLAVSTLLPLSVVLLVLGLSIAPTMITLFSLVAEVAPPQRITTALTLLAGTTGVGYALGSGLAGRLADWGGHTPAYAVTVAAGALAAGMALAAQRSASVPQRVADRVDAGASGPTTTR